MFFPAAAARWMTSSVAIMVMAIPFTTVSGSPTMILSTVCSRHGMPMLLLIRSITWAAVSAVLGSCAGTRPASVRPAPDSIRFRRDTRLFSIAPQCNARSSDLPRIVDPHVRRKQCHRRPSNAGQPFEGDLTKARETREIRDARVRDPRALPELQAFQRLHSAENIEAAICDPGHARVVSLQPRQASDVLRSGIARLPAIHAPQALEVLTAAHVTEPGVGHVHRHEFPERGKARQPGERRVVHVLATHREAAKGRHLRQCGESSSLRGNRASDASSTFLQLTARPRRAGISDSAANPRPPRLGHSRPQMYSMVCERLSARNPSSLATAPWPINIRSRGMAAI